MGKTPQVAFLQVKSKCRVRKKDDNGAVRVLWLEAYVYIVIGEKFLEREGDIGKFLRPASLRRLVRLYLQIRNLDVWALEA